MGHEIYSPAYARGRYFRHANYLTIVLRIGHGKFICCNHRQVVTVEALIFRHAIADKQGLIRKFELYACMLRRAKSRKSCSAFVFLYANHSLLWSPIVLIFRFLKISTSSIVIIAQ